MKYAKQCLITAFLAMSINFIPAPLYAAQNKPAEQSLDNIAAVVNDGIITQNDLNTAIEHAKHLMAQSNYQVPSLSALKKQTLQQLIYQKLQMQLATRYKIKVTDEQVAAAMQRIATKQKITMAQLLDTAASKGISKKTFHAEVKKQLLMSQVQRQAVSASVVVTKADIQNLRQKFKAHQQAGKQYHLLDVIVSLPDNPSFSQQKAASSRAAAIMAKLQNGASKVQQSKDVATHDLGWSAGSELPALFMRQLSKMKNGDIAGSLKAANGYHVIKLLDSRGKNAKLPSAAQLKNIVYQQKFEKALQKWLVSLRKTAYVKISEG